MAFTKDKIPPEFADLKTVLAQTRTADNALSQTVAVLIDRLDQLKTLHSDLIGDIQKKIDNLANLINNIISGGTGGGGTGGDYDLDYVGDYSLPVTYTNGDIVVGADGIAYVCVKDGTTTPPEPWPGSSPGTVQHHLSLEPGGGDPMEVDALPGKGSLRTLGTGTNQAAQGSGVAWLNLGNIFLQPQVISHSSAPGVDFDEFAQPANLRRFKIVGNGQYLKFQPANDAGGGLLDAFVITRDGNVRANNGFFEFGRPFGIGRWSEVPFNAGNFPGITIGTVFSNKYTLIGTTLIWQIGVSGNVIAQTADLIMIVPMPHVGTYNGGSCGHSYYNGTFGGAEGSSLQWICVVNQTNQISIRNPQYGTGINPGLFEIMATVIYTIA